MHDKLAILILVASCTSSDTGDGMGSNTGSNNHGEGGLAIISLTATAKEITDASGGPTAAQSVEVIAIVNDVDGLDTISGGQLLDTMGATYGAFGTGAQKGTFTASLSWLQATQVSPLDFSAPGATRTLVAKFFDNDGHMATASLELGFYCTPRDHAAACDGVCTDLWDDDSCGSCDHECPNGSVCNKGTCATPALSTCLPAASVTTCGDYCESIGQACANTCGCQSFNGKCGAQPYDGASCNGLGIHSGVGCDDEVAVTEQTGSVRCCCTQ